MSLLHVARVALVVLASGALACGAHRPTEPAPRAAPPSVLEAAPEPFDPAGIGSLEARSTATGDASLVRLASVHIVAQQRGDMAEVEAIHTFKNESDATLEGTFRFPMPDGALLTGLAMMIDGRLMEGELVEREQARKVYETIVDSMQDPALLEWEHGSIFKMRVFPIEPRGEKVVTIRYLTPLRASADAWEFVQSTRATAGSEPLSELRVDWRGERVFSEKNVAAGRLLAFRASPAGRVLREQRPDGAYAVLRVRPDFARFQVSGKPPAKDWFVVVDTSRSSLEEMPRMLEALEIVLTKLPSAARFQMIRSDLDATAWPQGLVSASPESIAQATAFVKAVGPDGASDLGRACALVADLSRNSPDSAVLYLGDAEPTWGLTRAEDLLALWKQRLSAVSFFPMLFGASVNDELAGELSSRSNGRRARIRRREDLDAFASTLARAVPVLNDIEVEAAPGTEVLTNGPLSLEPGRELVLIARAPTGRDPLAGLRVKAKIGSRELDLTPRDAAEPTGGVARRFGAALVRKLERAQSPKPQVVAASLDYGVISKFTSFLVLESEQAYAAHGIARRNATGTEPPRVTGANLESSEGTSISADRIQPGDPEIFVDAPRDALKVSVAFPFGETKLAIYDPEARGGLGAWMVRFLVARDTKEGEYEALAHIQHADGQFETRKVRYMVDNTPPELVIRLRRAARPGLVEVVVEQPSGGALSDLKRVELQTPQGSVYQLTAIRWGTFRAFIPQQELRAGTLRVVGFDQALNHSVEELRLP